MDKTKIRFLTTAVFIVLLSIIGCKQQKQQLPTKNEAIVKTLGYAKGFTIVKEASGVTVITITSPWPNAGAAFTYALIPKEKLATITLNKAAYDAIVSVPVERIVATSTTHIPALEALGVENRLVGFPNTDYISSKTTRERIASGEIKELGSNEALNTEMTLELQPDLVVGFSINNQNSAYETLQRSNIPVVYNGDWTEETPLGKAEWIKFFAPFFQMERKADSIFKGIETSYTEAKELAKKSTSNPTVFSGALYKDVWYMPGGKSWAAQFLKDANSNYLWSATEETGSLSLSIESVLEKAQNAQFWVSPSQFTSYQNMKEANRHYQQFGAFKNKRVFTFAKTMGDTGGLLYYELAPQRPDLVLKDLIHILHPELLPEHQLFFFKPLD
ncbi:ABC transporter substrate-binding protein [uncultured Kriegella sp.]|uniref:ABC transporter substrate-binding protein n=1 Tax=uncultured Kriegella sp. TaxID=1798910 RepID=UPI0030DBEDE3|tara:strand:+ start:461704 stop:462867 length:1164 start_codon:yes stop_codon:yes gene_type:complete